MHLKSDVIFKNISSSITMCLQDSVILAFFFLVYKPILIKVSMITNNIKRQIFYEMKYDLKGHKMSS